MNRIKKSGFQNRKAKKDKDAAQKAFKSLPEPTYITNISAEEIHKINEELTHHRGYEARSIQSASMANKKKSDAAKARCETLRKKYTNLTHNGKRVSAKFIADAEKMSLSTVYRCLKIK